MSSKNRIHRDPWLRSHETQMLDTFVVLMTLLFILGTGWAGLHYLQYGLATR
jgi:hypothetical protein